MTLVCGKAQIRTVTQRPYTQTLKKAQYLSFDDSLNIRYG
jgi:hypothetical protein